MYHSLLVYGMAKKLESLLFFDLFNWLTATSSPYPEASRNVGISVVLRLIQLVNSHQFPLP
jgi:hypothetical protein